jgi:hypothetical protein
MRQWLNISWDLKITNWQIAILVLTALILLSINIWGFMRLSLSLYLFGVAVLTILCLIAVAYLIRYFIIKIEIVAMIRVGLLVAFILILVFLTYLSTLAFKLGPQWWTFIGKEDSINNIDWSGTAAILVAVLSLPAGIAYWLSQERADSVIRMFLGVEKEPKDESKEFVNEKDKAKNLPVLPTTNDPTTDGGGS